MSLLGLKHIFIFYLGCYFMVMVNFVVGQICNFCYSCKLSIKVILNSLVNSKILRRSKVF